MRAKAGFSASGSLSNAPARSLRSLTEATVRRKTSPAAVVNFTSPRTARLIFLRTALSGNLAQRQTPRAHREYARKCVHPKAEAGGVLSLQSHLKLSSRLGSFFQFLCRRRH